MIKDKTFYIERKLDILHRYSNGESLRSIGKIYSISFQRVQELLDGYKREKTTSKPYVYKISKEQREWNKEHKLTYKKDRRLLLRTHAMHILGNKCMVCGIDDIRCLQIDHIDGGGSRELKSTSQDTIYKWIVNNPGLAVKKYQILCANHNWIKRYDMNENGSWRYK